MEPEVSLLVVDEFEIPLSADRITRVAGAK
jgi:hypothetical protein